MFRMGAAAIPGLFRHEDKQEKETECIEESHNLLLEMTRHEPTIQNCFNIMKSACLSRGIKVEVSGKAITGDFNRFIQKYYTTFCEHAIVAMFTCGFVPWRLRRLANGDVVPEVIPMGLFKWTAETTTNKRRRLGYATSAARRPDGYDTSGTRDGDGRKGDTSGTRDGDGRKGDTSGTRDGDGKRDGKRDGKSVTQNGGNKLDKSAARGMSFHRQWNALGRQPMPIDDDESKMIRYKVNFTESCGIREEDIEIYEYTPPTNNISEKSSIHQTVMSPLAHILMDYKHLRSLGKQIAYADAWNSQAKFICSYQTTSDKYNINEGNPIRNDWMPQNRIGGVSDQNIPCEVEQNAYVRDAVLEKIVSSKNTEHPPTVYTLPKNSKLESSSSLGIIQDPEQLHKRFASDISNLLGVPFDLVAGSKTGIKETAKILSGDRNFSSSILRLCMHLQILLGNVYVATYGGVDTDAIFTINATPRIEITSVDDIAKLLELGLVSSENAMDISNMLLGIDLQSFGSKMPGSASSQKMFVTPTNMIGMEKSKSSASKS
jgi:hypothetical protein